MSRAGLHPPAECAATVRVVADVSLPVPHPYRQVARSDSKTGCSTNCCSEEFSQLAGGVDRGTADFDALQQRMATTTATVRRRLTPASLVAFDVLAGDTVDVRPMRWAVRAWPAEGARGRQRGVGWRPPGQAIPSPCSGPQDRLAPRGSPGGAWRGQPPVRREPEFGLFRRGTGRCALLSGGSVVSCGDGGRRR